MVYSFPANVFLQLKQYPLLSAMRLPKLIPILSTALGFAVTAPAPIKVDVLDSATVTRSSLDNPTGKRHGHSHCALYCGATNNPTAIMLGMSAQVLGSRLRFRTRLQSLAPLLRYAATALNTILCASITVVGTPTIIGAKIHVSTPAGPCMSHLQNRH